MLNKNIALNAGIIFSYLNDAKVMDLHSLHHLTYLNENDILLALGWLSRDSKIQIQEESEELKISLIE